MDGVKDGINGLIDTHLELVFLELIQFSCQIESSIPHYPIFHQIINNK